MEQRTNFSLEENIAKFLNQLYRSGNFTSIDILELESHIKDEVDSLIQKDLTEEEAFMIATKRIGQIDVLTNEYRKTKLLSFGERNWTQFYNGSVLILFAYSLSLMLSKILSSISLVTELYLNAAFIILGVFIIKIFKKQKQLKNILLAFYCLFIIIYSALSFKSTFDQTTISESFNFWFVLIIFHFVIFISLVKQIVTSRVNVAMKLTTQ